METTEILTQVIRDTVTLLKCDDASIVLWDAKQDSYDQGAATNRQLEDTITQRIRREGGVTRWVIDHQKPLLINDIKNNPFSTNPIAEESQVQSFMAVPVEYQGEKLGVLYALSQTSNFFEQSQLETLQILARMAAMAIVNSRLVNSLREVNAFKDAMLGLAAHDLRNPLSRVVGYLDILLAEIRPLPTEYEEWVGNVWRALTQMGDLIDGILHYERLSQGTISANFEERDLNEVVHQVIEPFKNDAKNKAQTIQLELNPSPLILPIDPFLLGEALANLVSNAIKYSPNETQITVRTRAEPSEFQVHVVDQGPGIDPQFHEKVFQPFTRLPGAKTQRGTGLGLSLVKMIVELHGGKIRLDSTVGAGSNFIMRFPVP